MRCLDGKPLFGAGGRSCHALARQGMVGERHGHLFDVVRPGLGLGNGHGQDMAAPGPILGQKMECQPVGESPGAEGGA